MDEIELLKNRLQALGETGPAAVVEAAKKRLAELEEPSQPITLAEAFGLPPAAAQEPKPLYDLYDPKLKCWFRGYTLAQLVDVAMRSGQGDELELRIFTR